MTRSFRFARNVSWSLLGQVGVAGLSFLLIPYLVAGLGVERYGLYILLHAAGSYLLLLSLGGGNATIKYVAQFCAERDARGLKEALRYASALHILGALLAAALLWWGARFCAVRIFHIPEPLADDAVFVLRCAAAAAIFASLTQFAGAILQGLQRFDWQNLLVLCQSGLMIAGAAGVVRLGLGLRGTAAWYVALSAGLSALALGLAWRLLPSSAGFQEGRGLKLRAFADYSLSLGLGRFAWIVTFQFDKIFVARYASISDLTLYGVPSGILQRLQVLPAVVSTVLVPMMSELRGPGAPDDLARIYLKSARFLLWVMLPVFVLLFALMPQFLGLWLGGEFGSRSVWPARLLILSHVFFMITHIPHAVMTSQARAWYISAAVWAQAAVSLLSWWWLVPRHGILGAAAGALLAQALPACAYLHVAHRRVLRLSWGRFFDEALFAPLSSAALLLALVLPVHHLASSWARLAGLAGAGVLLYYGSTWLLLDRVDRDLLRRFLRFEPSGETAGVP